jgi:hypothetical protein
MRTRRLLSPPMIAEPAGQSCGGGKDNQAGRYIGGDACADAELGAVGVAVFGKRGLVLRIL